MQLVAEGTVLGVLEALSRAVQLLGGGSDTQRLSSGSNHSGLSAQ